MEFNRRVLEEALNPNLPLLEKVKFISIFFANLDEFYMIRVAGIKDQIIAKVIDPTIDGLTPSEELHKIENEVRPMIDTIYEYWENEIVPSLKNNDVHLLTLNQLNKEEKNILLNILIKKFIPY
ncbi:MAG: hypothetical protein U5K00_20230 [Melioribacteraceae bacterium]|nr:hypothetical protein [Melioribacteraceae bacterium]